jgi:DNA-binding transcriptional regulator LsrR (DeoR family)
MTVEETVRDFEDALVVDISQRFLGWEKPQDIADVINNTWTLNSPLTREQIYPAIKEARRRRFFVLLPPLDNALQERVASKYGLPADRLHVVPVRGDGALGILADRAADLILQRIREVAETKERVHLGLGAGGTLTQVAPRLAARLRLEPALPKLALHALSSGFNVTRPQTAPNSFFSSFHDVAPDIEYYGLFTPPAFSSRTYAREIGEPGVRDSFKWAEQIDIVITALAQADDPHAELTLCVRSEEELERMRELGWIGDVLYRPYSTKGPLARNAAAYQAVTLFELPKLVKLAGMPGKHVVLISGPCAACKKRKGPALRPLLMCPELRVWSEIVMDIPTAEQLLVDPVLTQ